MNFDFHSTHLQFSTMLHNTTWEFCHTTNKVFISHSKHNKLRNPLLRLSNTILAPLSIMDKNAFHQLLHCMTQTQRISAGYQNL
jgi:hypothetical protein